MQSSKISKKMYSYAFLIPAAIVFTVFFLLPTIASFFFSLTRWTLMEWEFIGLDNFKMFFSENYLSIGLRNTIIYAVLTCGLKVVFGMLLATYLCSKIRTKVFLRAAVFFPNLLSTIAVGLTFSGLMHPLRGVINVVLGAVGIQGPDWLGNPVLALYSIVLVDVWKGVGIATVIYIAGIMAIPLDYYEAARIDGCNKRREFWNITLPLSRPAFNSVVTLALIGGLRSFDLVWAMTKGGPGFATDVLASVIYKQYSAGFFGLSTAGNVVLFLLVSLISFPVYRYLNSKEVDI